MDVLLFCVERTSYTMPSVMMRRGQKLGAADEHILPLFQGLSNCDAKDGGRAK